MQGHLWKEGIEDLDSLTTDYELIHCVKDRIDGIVGILGVPINERWQQLLYRQGHLRKKDIEVLASSTTLQTRSSYMYTV